MAQGFDLSKLNPQQREAATALGGHVLILAGAGTGKTRTITARISHMLSQGIRPENILAVTFTNKAATEMKERVSGMVARGVASRLTLCTFHSLCVRILRQSIEHLGYKRNFSIHTASEQTGLIRRILVRRGGRDEKVEAGQVIARISTAKNRGSPITAEEDAFLHAIATDYENEKKAMNAVDFDDLLVLAVRVLREHGDTRDEWRRRFPWIMVDEFQDTNRLQLELLRLLTGAMTKVCVVGDDDQSIYGWRGAEVENLLQFERWFPDPKVIKLEENYRSTTPILHTANSIIRHNLNRREKKLWSRNHGEEKVRIISMPGDTEEAAFIVDEIQMLSFSNKRPWEDFAILFRTNLQSRLFEEGLRERRIPYRMIGGMSFFDRREVKDLLAYLTLLVHPDDDIALLRVLNTPPRGLSTATAELAIERSRELKLSVWQTLGHPDFQPALSSRAKEAAHKFRDLIAKWTESAKTDYAAAASGLLEEIEYMDFTRRSCKTPEEAKPREESLASIIDDLRRHKEKHPDAGLQGFLDDVALNGDRDDQKDDLDKKQGVSLITLHAAKGLEFPHVYLVGVEEGTMPHKRALEEGGRDEERRLFYVGVTRAMRRLTLTWCMQRKKWGQLTACMPSSFFHELDMTHVDPVAYNDIMNQPVSADEREAEMEIFRAMFADLEGPTEV